MRLFRTKDGCVVEREWRYFRVDRVDWDELLAQEDLHGALGTLIEGRESTAGFHAAELLAPIGRQEVWAAGVTYLRSRAARSTHLLVPEVIIEAMRPRHVCR